LPGLFGLPLAAQFPDLLLPNALLLAIILLLIGTAVLYFVWQQRHALSSLLTLSPLPRFEAAVALALLFLVPIGLAALGSNTIDVLSIRYLLVTWQASAIILGIFLAVASKRSSALTIVLVGLWVFQLAVLNLRDIDQQWDTRRDRFSPASIAMLEQALQEAEITSGYADYWTAYALDYLTDERITLAPYNGIDRYPPYTEHVIGQSRIALIFPGNLLPEETSTIQEVQQFLSGFTIAGPAFPEFHSDMAGRRLQQRLRTGSWEVWLLEK
jgi:hypothetical protein